MACGYCSHGGESTGLIWAYKRDSEDQGIYIFRCWCDRGDWSKRTQYPRWNNGYEKAFTTEREKPKYEPPRKTFVDHASVSLDRDPGDEETTGGSSLRDISNEKCNDINGIERKADLRVDASIENAPPSTPSLWGSEDASNGSGGLPSGAAAGTDNNASAGATGVPSHWDAVQLDEGFIISVFERRDFANPHFTRLIEIHGRERLVKLWKNYQAKKESRKLPRSQLWRR